MDNLPSKPLYEISRSRPFNSDILIYRWSLLKEKNDGPKKIRDVAFTCCFDNTLQETWHVWKWN